MSKGKKKSTENKNKDVFEMFDDKTQKEMEDAIAKRFGGKRVNDSNENFKSLDKNQQQKVMIECNEIFKKLAQHIHKSPDSNEVRELLIQWHNWLRTFYEPSMELLSGLGVMYAKSPDFRKTF